MNIFDQIGGAGPVSRFGVKVKAGAHVFTIDSCALKAVKGHGEIVELKLVTIKSNEHDAGSKAQHAFFVSSAGFQGENAQKECRAFVMAAIGMAEPPATLNPVQKAEYEQKIGQQAKKMTGEPQPARGLLVKAVGIDHAPKLKQDGVTMGKGWTEVIFENIPGQTAAAISEMRRKLEAKENGETVEAPPVETPAEAPEAGLLDGFDVGSLPF